MAQPQTQDSLGLFVDRLTEEKGLTSLDREVLTQVKTDLLDRVEDRINAVIVEHIPADQMEFFEKLVERGEKTEIHAFCERHISGLNEIIAKELVAFRDTYLGL